MTLQAHEIALLRTREHAPTTDNSQLARALQPFWNATLRFVPLRVAPNTLTVLGSVAVAVPTLLALGFSPTLTTRLPGWLIAAQILGVFVFQTLDALDGKQARRTGASSPLGSWLDHALDIITMQLVLVGGCASMQAGAGVATWALLAGTLLNNYLLHWESSHTRALILGNGTSITEAQAMAMGLHASALVLPTLWTNTLTDFLPSASAWPLADVPLSALVLVGSVVGVGGAGALASIVRALGVGVPRAESGRRLVCIVSLLVPATAAVVMGNELVRLLVGAAALLVGTRAVGVVVLGNLLRRAPPTLDVPVVVVALASVLAIALQEQALFIGGAALSFGLSAVLVFFIHTARVLAAALGERVFFLPPTKAR